MRGVFLALEGIDGCGKTTQLNYLSDWLPQSGLMPKDSRLIITREPGGTFLGKQLRQLLLNPSNNNCPEPLTELLLYAADRAQHISEKVKPCLEKGDWVISDRFSGSTLAYQGFGRQLNINLIKQLEHIATQGISPDLTFFLDLSIQESLYRRSERKNDRIESEGEIFLRKVAKGFAEISQERAWIKISASMGMHEVSNEIKSNLKKYLAQTNNNI